MSEKLAKIAFNKFLGKKGKLEKAIIGGMMNHSYIFSCDSKKYLVYIPSESGKEMVIRPLEYENIKLISDLDIAPKNLYFDTETGVKINEYCEGESLDKLKLEDNDIKAVAAILKKLHKSKLLSRTDYPLFTSLMGYEEQLFAYTTAVDASYKTLKNILIANKSFLMKFKKCICHNDAQRSNFIRCTDGSHKIIDFEFMMNNDPIYDIATFGNADVNEGYKLLTEYFGSKLTDVQKRRYFLWRIYVSVQWYLVAMIKHYKDGDALGIDFRDVADHFIDNALAAMRELAKLDQIA